MEMTNALRRSIINLDSRSERRQTGAWKAEGTKCVMDLLHAFPVNLLAGTHEWIKEHEGAIRFINREKIVVQTKKQMERLSRMDSTPPVVAVFDLPKYEMSALSRDTLYLALDTIQDPGNLGTIIRTADWFGIKDIFCSMHTADAFAPKVVMATMGALARVRVHYCALESLLQGAAQIGISIYGTFLDGEDLYKTELTEGGVIIMGNEGKGVSDTLKSLCSRKLLIPSYPHEAATSESLNVGSATAIVISEFRRRLN